MKAVSRYIHLAMYLFAHSVLFGCGSGESAQWLENDVTANDNSSLERGEPVPAGLVFVDMDESSGEIQGIIRILKANNEADITHYTVYWADENHKKLPATEAMGIVDVTGGDVSYEISADTKIPEGATSFIVYGSANGEDSALGLAIDFSDVTASAEATLPFESIDRPYSVEVDKKGFKIDGEYRILRGGTLQWFRLPEETWEDRIKRFKALGYNTIDMYVSWNVTEPEEGKFNFSEPNLTKFLDLAKKHGLFVYFRPGPYITNEVDNGGVPSWLLTKTTKSAIAKDGKPNLRTQDEDYLEYVEKYFNALNTVISPYLASNGGPIILYAVENEYDYFPLFGIVDRLFQLDGQPERGPDEIRPDLYFTALRDMLLDDGIDVPIATCPGQSVINAMGDVPGYIPLPNVYPKLGGDFPERVGYRLLRDMHDPEKHNGVYQNVPTGTTETVRDPVVLKRLVMGGMDAVFSFNIFGMAQEGRQNAIVMKSNPALDAGSFTNFTMDQIQTFFVRPQVALFHNVIDYYGAVSPSGVHRENYYAIRRDNMFFDTVEKTLALATIPNRSGSFSDADDRLVIDNKELGANETTLLGLLSSKVHYWLDAGDDTYFLNLVNETDQDQEIPTNGITLNGKSFPQYTSLIVPAETQVSDSQFKASSASNAMILVHGYPLLYGGKIQYTTSDVLTYRPFNDAQLLVLYGKEGLQGELALADFDSQWSIVHQDPSFTINERTDQSVILSYAYSGNQHLIMSGPDGQRLHILITTKEQAGRFWFFEVNNSDFLIAGLDYIDRDSLGIQDHQVTMMVDYDKQERPLLVMSEKPVVLPGDWTQTQVFDLSTQAVTYAKPTQMTLPSIPDVIQTGRMTTDTAETATDFDDSGWIAWNGEPKPLEENQIYKGHAWYRASLDLDEIPGQGIFANSGLKIDHATDIVGIYVNGTYLTTMVPMGTELDSRSLNSKYQFPELEDYLQIGKNVIAFKTEVWGHGSFMFPRGVLSATTVQIPGLGFDSLKGLYGKATIGNFLGIGGIELTDWKVKPMLEGERAGYHTPEFDDVAWDEVSIPLALDKGQVHWYRTEFDSSIFPSPSDLHAPIALNLKGYNAKATIFLNGRIIGRWLSDDDWINRGFWGLIVRDMWINTPADSFPVPYEVLNPPGTPNKLAIIFEDTSHSDQIAGRIDELDLIYAREDKSTFNGTTEFVTNEKGRKQLKMTWGTSSRP